MQALKFITNVVLSQVGKSGAHGQLGAAGWLRAHGGRRPWTEGQLWTMHLDVCHFITSTKMSGQCFPVYVALFCGFFLLKLSQEVFGLHNGKTTAGWLVIHQKGS